MKRSVLAAPKVGPSVKRRVDARAISALALVGAVLSLFACGGGGSGGTTPGVNGTISGTSVKGPVGGAAMAAFAITNGTMGAQIGSGTTDPQGNFSVSVGNYSGPVLLQMSGGTYTDEATNASMTMQPGDVMTGVIPSIAAGSTTTGIQVTPLTSMAQSRAKNMAGGMTAENITTANAAVGSYFSVNDILHTVPMNPLVPGSGAGATQDMKNYGMTVAAMSQYAKDIGMTTSSSGIVTAMMDDASDGVMDGMMGSTAISMGGMGGMMGGNMQPAAGTAGLATAMSQFVESAMNKSGVQISDMQRLIDQLSGSSGQLPAAGGGAMNGTLSGSAFMGSFGSGTVMAFAIENGAMSGQLASSSTDSTGHFSMSIGAYSGPVMLQLSGGAYADEATGSTMTMLASDVMTAVVPSVTAGSTTTGIQVTPLTSMAQSRAKNIAGGMTAANITTANTAVANYFSAGDVLLTPPMDPAIAGSGAGADQSSRNYGMTIAAMSQYAKDIGMTTSSSGIVTAMMDDASDGVMDGMMGSTRISMGGMGGGMMGGNMMQPTAGTTGLATAMSEFVGSEMNKSGVQISDMQPLINKLSTSGGVIQ